MKSRPLHPSWLAHFVISLIRFTTAFTIKSTPTHLDTRQNSEITTHAVQSLLSYADGLPANPPSRTTPIPVFGAQGTTSTSEEETRRTTTSTSTRTMTVRPTVFETVTTQNGYESPTSTTTISGAVRVLAVDIWSVLLLSGLVAVLLVS